VWLSLLAVAVAGSGQGTSHNSIGTRRALAAIGAAKRDIPKELEAGHFTKACEDFTARTRVVLGIMMEGARGSCAAGFAHFDAEYGLSEPAHLINGKPGLRKRSGQQLRSIYQGMSSSPPPSALSRARIEGNAATHRGGVLARYEQGRWRLELTQPEANPKFIAQLKEGCDGGRLCDLELKAVKGEYLSIPDYRELKRLETAQIARYQTLQNSLKAAFSGNILPGGRPVDAGR
jgi:hypothetical protein